MSTPLSDYALLGDRRTAALVSRHGSIDWLCLPEFDSPAVFCALLGDHDNGRWLLGPRHLDQTETTWRYLPDSLVLETTHRTSGGTVTVTDLLPSCDDRVEVIRLVEGVEGQVELTHDLRLRFGYGRIAPWVHREPDDWAHGDGQRIDAVAGPDLVVLRGTRLPASDEHCHRDEFTVAAGERHVFVLTWSRSYDPAPAGPDPDQALADTLAEARDWIDDHAHTGPHAEAVRSSLVVLRAMTHRETGGIVAAPTTSLPEDLGGVRNWDYRYTWLRDASLTIGALIDAGMLAQVDAWRDWLIRAIAGDPDDLQIMYTIDGSRELPERTLDHLAGYAGSRPVRVGNGAVDQRQLDTVGEVMVALHALHRADVPPTPGEWSMARSLVTHLVDTWREPDNGLWEIRGEPHHFTHSRAYVWAAFDRALDIARTNDLPAPLELWTDARAAVYQALIDDGFKADINAFTQHDATTEVDASLLLLPVVGVVAADDPRFVGTVARIEQQLMRDGLVLRYRTSSGVDGLPGDEHPFLACSFWLVQAYALMGRLDDADTLMARLVAMRTDLGLLGEEYDPGSGRQMGNYPQAFSHLALVHAAVTLERERGKGGVGVEQR